MLIDHAPVLAALLLFVGVSFAGYWIIVASQGYLDAYELRQTTQAQQSLEEMFIFLDARKLFWINSAIAIVFFLISWILLDNLKFMILSGLIGFFGPRIFLMQMKKRRDGKFAAQFINALMMLGDGLRAGLNLPQAIELVEKEAYPPISQEFGLVAREYRLGVPIEKALAGMTKRVENKDLELLVTCVQIVYSMGGNLIEVFETLSMLIRERTKLEKKMGALTSQGKLQGLVVGLLPTFLGGLMFFMQPDLMLIMFRSPIGNIALMVMVALQITGFLILRKLTQITV